MQESGVHENQVVQIRGYADQQLRKRESPEDPSNRRISLIVQYLPKSNDAAEAEGTKAAEPPKDSEAPKSGEATKATEH
jgi:chemotaxis protein MotB